MIHMEQKNVTGPMDKAEAQAITDSIRNAVDCLGALVEQAHDRRAWKVMGYATWQAYVSEEFGFTRQRSYQLLDQGRVAKALSEATGDLSNVFDISARDAAAVKDDLPKVAAEVKQRVEMGEEPGTAIKETVAAAREAKARAKAEREANQAELDRQRDEFNTKLPAFVAEREQIKAEAIAARKAEPVDTEALTAEIEELREANAALEADVARLTEENKLYAEMKVQFEQGGFAKVIAGKDKVIEGLETRVYRESADKASWMKLSKFWEAEAKKLGFSRNAEIDIETGEVTNG